MASRKNQYDVIIVGGSYSGLAAAMALGRALRKVLIIDSGLPCNRQTPHSHNFLTQDGKSPAQISTLAKEQVAMYDTIEFLDGLVVGGNATLSGFEVRVQSGKSFSGTKLIFATGVKDIMPDIPGVAESWGISVLHCPYCHGYEVRGEKTGILGNGEFAFEFVTLISNWTRDLTLFTNGTSTLTNEQALMLKRNGVAIVEGEIARLHHVSGYIRSIQFKNGDRKDVKAIYTRLPFEQHCSVPSELGCELTEDGFIKVDAMQKTTVAGVFACGDNVTRMRSVANAVGMGTFTGAVTNRELCVEEFNTNIGYLRGDN